MTYYHQSYGSSSLYLNEYERVIRGKGPSNEDNGIEEFGGDSRSFLYHGDSCVVQTCRYGVSWVYLLDEL